MMLNRFQQTINRLEVSLGSRMGNKEKDKTNHKEKSLNTEQKMKKISHSLTKLLRHGKVCIVPDSSGNCPMNSGGRVQVEWCVNQLKKEKLECTVGDIQAVVAMQDNDNLRMAIENVDDVLYIYCFQGHDISFYEPNGPIEFDKIWQKLQGSIEAIHSTKAEYVQSILEHGLMFQLPDTFLSEKERHKHSEGRFVHMWNRVQSAKKGRKGADAFVNVDMARAMLEGIEFYIAGNGVILATQPIPGKFLRDITSEMTQLTESEIELDPFSDDVEGNPLSEQYVSWINIPTAHQNELRQHFAEDLWNGKQNGSTAAKLLLDILMKKYKKGSMSTTIPDLRHELLAGEAKFKFDIFDTFYQCVQLPGLYMVMINGRRDSDLEKMATALQFPRGLPVLWKPKSFLDIRGFYPKFPNDRREDQTFDSNLLNGAKEINFFLKWSGFLLHVFAFHYEDRYYWTVLSKKTAYHANSPYIGWGMRLLNPYMKDEKLVMELANKHIYIGGEALFTQDVHGYIVKKDDFIVTCVGHGSYVDLISHRHANQEFFVKYMSIEDVIAFCGLHNLPRDTGYRIEKDRHIETDALKPFIAELFDQRDFMRCSDFRSRIKNLSSKYRESVVVHEIHGTKVHEEIVGENLEGFVMNMLYQDGSRKTYKVKLPYYTWRTFFLRELIEEIFPEASAESYEEDSAKSKSQAKTAGFSNDEFAFEEALVPDVEVLNQDTVNKIFKYTSSWCCTVTGKSFFTNLCKCAVMTLKHDMKQAVESQGYPVSYFSTGLKFKQRLHVLVADYAEGLNTAQINRYVNEFDRMADDRDLKMNSYKPTVYICVGPVGYGKSVSTKHLAKLFIQNGIQVDVIDGDYVAGTLQRTLALKKERNAMTLGAIWKALMSGRVPLVSIGGGQVCDMNSRGVICNLKKQALDVFSCEITLVVAVMEDVSMSARPTRTNIQDISGKNDTFEELINSIYTDQPAYLQYLQKVLNDRVKREEINQQSDGAKLNFMSNVSLSNRPAALAVLNAADYAFSIPCKSDEEHPAIFIQQSVVGWPQILNKFKLIGPIPGRFSQLRAVVFKNSNEPSTKQEDEAKHITLYFAEKKGKLADNGEKVTLSYQDVQKLDDSIRTIESISGKVCRMVLNRTTDSEISTTQAENIAVDFSSELTDGIIQATAKTQVSSFENRLKSGVQNRKSMDQARTEIATWSLDQVMNAHLTREMFDENLVAIFNEEAAILERKRDILEYIQRIQGNSKNDASIEAVYVPSMNEICWKFHQGKLAHVTLSASKVEPVNSETMIRWFLSNKKPEKFVLQGEDGKTKYVFSDPRATREYTYLVNKDAEPKFHPSAKNGFKQDDLLEMRKEIQGNSYVSKEDVKFSYVGLVPIA